MEISGAFNRSVLIPTMLGKGHHTAVPLAVEFCCLWPVKTLRHAVQMNCFQRLTSKLSSQLTQFGSWQGWALQRKPRVGLPPTGLFAGWFPSRDSCQFPAPTAGKGPVSLHCPWDIYCSVPNRVQAGRNLPCRQQKLVSPIPGVVAGAR